MMLSRERLLRQIMEFDFTEHELTLYLDTHPNDKNALRLHRQAAEKLRELTAIYEANFGPLTSSSNLSEDRWQWIESPWPWEN